MIVEAIFRSLSGAGRIVAFSAALVALGAAAQTQTTARTLVIEHAKGAYDNELLRKAVLLSVDWRVAARRAGLPVDNVIQRYAGGDTALGSTPADPETAKRLLAQTGYLDAGIGFAIATETDVVPIAEFAAAGLRRLGIVANVAVLRAEALRELRGSAAARADAFGEKAPVLFLALQTLSATGRPSGGVKPGQQVPLELALADLVVQRVDVGYDRDSRRLWARALIENVGRGPNLSNFVVEFVDRGNVFARTIASRAVGRLESGGTTWVEIETLVPTSAVGRVAAISATADTGDDVPESDERNNSANARRLVIEPPVPPPPPMPDLVIDALTARYDAPRQELELRFTVRNAGRGTAEAHQARVYEDSNRVPERSLQFPRLRPGQSQTQAIRIAVPDRTLGQVVRLSAHVDAAGRIDETAETNNTASTRRISIPKPVPPPLPDLVIESLVPTFDAAARELRIAVSVRNAGEGAAAPSQLRVLDRNGLIPTQTRPTNSLPPKSATRLTLRVPVAAGALGNTVRLFAQADIAGQVDESNEQNNTLRADELPLPRPAPPPLPDLVIDRFTLDYRGARQELVLDVAVTNAGKGEAAGNRLRISEAGGAIASHTVEIPPLGPGRTFGTAVRIPVPDGALGQRIRMIGRADAQGRIAETDETNNEAETRTERLPAPVPEPRPDLIVKRLTANFDAESGQITVGALVQNIGGAASQTGASVAFSDRSGALGADFAVGQLPPLGPDAANWATARLPAPDSARGRTAQIFAAADATQAVDEADEANNLSETVALALPKPAPDPLPDLTVSALEAAFAAARGQLTVRAEIRNGGRGWAAPHRVIIAETRGALPERSLAVPAIGPGGTSTLVAVFDLPDRLAGRSLRMRATADAGEAVAEADETNNSREIAAIDIPPSAPDPLADLTIGSVETTQDLLATRLDIEIVVENIGAAASPKTELEIVEPGGIVLGRATVPQIAPGGRASVTLTTRPARPLTGRALIVEYIVDAPERVAEADEGNNSRVDTLALRAPVLPWAGGAAAILVGLVLVFRGRGPRPDGASGDAARRPEPDHRTETEPAATPPVRWRPRPDKGRQSIEPDQAAPMIEAELVLRAIPDRGVAEIVVETPQDEART